MTTIERGDPRGPRSPGRGGSRRPEAGSALRLVLAAAFLAAAPAAATRAPELQVQAPPELAAAAAEIRGYGLETFRPALERTGLLDAGGPIRIFLLPESSAAARATPRWVAGTADGAAGLVALLPARVEGYPDRGLEALVQHEVAHVLVARASRGQGVPRWFDEGLAMAASRAGDLGDRARVALAVLTDDRLPLARLDAAFAGGASEVASAYALARDFYRELERRFGTGVGAGVLAGVARGETFKVAFQGATGQPLSEVETTYWRRRTLWDRWVPIATSSAALWGGITLLALAAFRRRRAIDDRIRARWEAEPQAEAGGDDSDGDGNGNGEQAS